MESQPNSATIQVLQTILTGVLNGSQQHFMHATINQHHGFTKLAARMLAEHNDEVLEAGKIVARILELGGVPVLEAQKLEIFPDVESQLRSECQAQFEGLAELERMFNAQDYDVATENLLVAYIEDETRHAAWLKQQVDLLKAIGLQNYLAAQL